MNYKTKHKQNNIFPVNYPKNHPETPTMNEATKHRPKSSPIKLNFPKMKLPELFQLKQMMALTSAAMARYSSLGGLIFLTTFKRSIRLMAKMLAPLITLVNIFLKIVIDKFDEVSDDFFSFMDTFFLMDEEQLIIVAVETKESISMFKKNKGRLNYANTRFVAFRAKMNIPFLKPKRITFKLPLKTILRRLSPIKMLFKFPFSERVLMIMDSMILRDYAQNPFAHDE